jgi:hypothetical protein
VTATATIAGVSFSPGSYIFERDSSVGTGWTYRTIAAATRSRRHTSATYADEVAADNPTTFLRFENNTTNEGSVSEVYTPTSITYGAALGDGSNAAVFNGSSSMLAAPQGAGTGLGGCTAFTVEAIVKSNSFATSQVIGLQNNIWEFQINTVGRISVNINGGAGAAQTSGGLTVGVPAHVAATYDGTSAKLYINGTEVASAAKTGALNNYGTAPPRIGSNGTAVFFNGSIDGYALYRNSALSAARILAHATAALG